MAVVACLDTDGAREDIQRHVVHTLGLDYPLRAVVSLQDIGLERFPVNATHKVIKQVLEELVGNYLQV